MVKASNFWAVKARYPWTGTLPFPTARCLPWSCRPPRAAHRLKPTARTSQICGRSVEAMEKDHISRGHQGPAWAHLPSLLAPLCKPLWAETGPLKGGESRKGTCRSFGTRVAATEFYAKCPNVQFLDRWGPHQGISPSLVPANVSPPAPKVQAGCVCVCVSCEGRREETILLD